MDEPHNSQQHQTSTTTTQNNPTEVQTIKRVDPIWKYLYSARIWNYGYPALAIILFAFNGQIRWKDQGSLYSIVIIVFAIIAFLASQSRQEHYWLRIGTQRLAALQDATAFSSRKRFISDAEVLPLPASIDLIWNRKARMAIIVGYLILLALLAIFVILFVIQRQSWLLVLMLVWTLAVVMASMLLASCFVTAYKNTQSIELTDEGITTRYRRQQRTIRWDEARLFAEYNASGINKNNFGLAYELSNDQTVVRWSQKSTFSLFLTLQSNIPDKHHDFSNMLTRVNATVAARTGLPLLNLEPQGRSTTKHIKPLTAPAIRSAIATEYQQPAPTQIEQPEQTEPHKEQPEPLPTFAPHDPLVERARISGEMLLGFGLMAGVGLLMTIIGLLNHTAWASGTLTIGIPLLALGLLIFVLLFFTQCYWQRYTQRRQLAIQEPQSFLALTQPTPAQETPQPQHIEQQIKRTNYFVMTFVTALVVTFIASLLTNFSFVPGRLLGALVVGLLFALFVGLFSLFRARAVRGSQITITPDGLATRLNNVEMAVNWQDVRLFSTYKTLGADLFHVRIRQYELASDYMIVRWQISPGRFGLYRPIPRMSNAEYERWQEQFYGYIVARTGVPLVDLDDPKFTSSQQ